MSVRMHLGKSRFSMRKSREPQALEALRDAQAAGRFPLTRGSPDMAAQLRDAMTLDEAVLVFGFTLRRNVREIIRGINLSPDQRQSDDEMLFVTLGPFVDRGSYVEYAEESVSEPKRAEFDGKRCRVKNIAALTPEDHEEDEDEDRVEDSMPPSQMSWAERVTQKPSQARKYAADASFQVGEWLEHKVFGAGVVLAAQDRTKIRVMFESGERTLVYAGPPAA